MFSSSEYVNSLAHASIIIYLYNYNLKYFQYFTFLLMNNGLIKMLLICYSYNTSLAYNINKFSMLSTKAYDKYILKLSLHS